MSSLTRPADADFATSKSSTTTSVARRAAPSPGPDLSLGCAPARLAPFFASTPRGSPGTAAIGITFWSSVGSSRRSSPISTVSITRVAPNDLLLLGMKGSISEFELGILRARMLDAARSKARRGELRISVPIGYLWHREIGLGFDPDVRVQEATRLIFSRFRQFGSARQAHLSLRSEGIHFPRPSDGKKMASFEWAPIRYRNVIAVLKNPFYAGAYAYGKSENRTAIVDGRARKTYGHHRPLEDCEILLKGHHE